MMLREGSWFLSAAFWSIMVFDDCFWLVMVQIGEDLFHRFLKVVFQKRVNVLQGIKKSGRGSHMKSLASIRERVNGLKLFCD